MEKKIYSFEVFGLKGKKIGVCNDDFLTQDEMVLKAQGILEGAGLLRTFVSVKVREKESTKYCYEINHYKVYK